MYIGIASVERQLGLKIRFLFRQRSHHRIGGMSLSHFIESCVHLSFCIVHGKMFTGNFSRLVIQIYSNWRTYILLSVFFLLYFDS